jgi:hypothetical protein
MPGSGGEVGEMTFTVSSNLPVSAEQIIASISEQERAEIEATGQNADRINWFWGMKAEEWIKRGYPKMLAYMALGRLVGRSASTVRNCYYTWKAFDDADREEYHTASWSVFNHARQCEDPETVLEYQRTEAAGVDEIESQFPVTAPREELEPRNVPVWAMPIYRRFTGLQAELRAEAEGLLLRLTEILEAA